MSRPGLAWITFNNISAVEFTDIASELHCGSVALLGNAPMPGFGRPIAADEVAAIRSRVADNGMIVSSLDMLPVGPDFDPAAHDALLELGATLGARQIGAGVFDPERDRVADNLSAFAARARTHDLRVGVEFVSFSPLRSLADACVLIDLVNDAGVTITFDVLHFIRGGGTLDELDEATVEKIGYAQISDGPPTMTADRLMWEAGSQRMIPGQGSFDLTGIFARLPAHLTVDIEVPMRDLDEAGVTPRDQARQMLAATSEVLARAAARRSG